MECSHSFGSLLINTYDVPGTSGNWEHSSKEVNTPASTEFPQKMLTKCPVVIKALKTIGQSEGVVVREGLSEKQHWS